MLNIQNAHIQNDEYVHFVYTLILSLWIPHISFVFIRRHALMLLKNIAEISVTINEQIQNIAQKKDTLCRRMYN